MLLMLSARHFLWVPEAWPGRRSETRLRQRGSRNKRQKKEGSRKGSSGRRSGQGRMRRGAVQCSKRVVQRGAEWIRAYVVGRVLFCLRGARTTSGNTGR